MISIPLLAAFVFARASAEGDFHETCTWRSGQLYFDSIRKVEYECQRVFDQDPRCVRLDLDECIGNLDGNLVLINSIPGHDRFEYDRYTNSCHECLYEKANTRLTCMCINNKIEETPRSNVYLKDFIRNEDGRLIGPDHLPNCRSEDIDC